MTVSFANNMTHWTNNATSRSPIWEEDLTTVRGSEYTVRMVFIVAMISFSIVGFFGNFLIILTIGLVRSLRSTRNVFLANLAVSDITLVVIVVPFNVISVLRGETYWHDKMTLCLFVASICAPGCLSAIWSNTGVAFNRYFFICRNKIYDKYFSPLKTVLWIIAVWALSFAIHLPNHLGWGHSGYEERFHLCTRETRLWSYSVFFSAVGIVLPLVISFLSYCRIYALVRTTTSARNHILGTETRNKVHVATVSSQVTHDGPRTVDDSNRLSHHRQSVMSHVARHSQVNPVAVNLSRKVRDELQLVRTLFRSFAVFLVAWLPLAVLLMLPDLDAPTWVYLLVVFLAHGSTATNSLFYFMTNDSFRNGFRTVMQKVRRNDHSTASRSRVGDEVSAPVGNGQMGSDKQRIHRRSSTMDSAGAQQV